MIATEVRGKNQTTMSIRLIASRIQKPECPILLIAKSPRVHLVHPKSAIPFFRPGAVRDRHICFPAPAATACYGSGPQDYKIHIAPFARFPHQSPVFSIITQTPWNS